jgi:hypothetical protein
MVLPASPAAAAAGDEGIQEVLVPANRFVPDPFGFGREALAPPFFF